MDMKSNAMHPLKKWNLASHYVSLFIKHPFYRQGGQLNVKELSHHKTGKPLLINVNHKGVPFSTGLCFPGIIPERESDSFALCTDRCTYRQISGSRAVRGEQRHCCCWHCCRSSWHCHCCWQSLHCRNYCRATAATTSYNRIPRLSRWLLRSTAVIFFCHCLSTLLLTLYILWPALISAHTVLEEYNFAPWQVRKNTQADVMMSTPYAGIQVF